MHAIRDINSCNYRGHQLTNEIIGKEKFGSNSRWIFENLKNYLSYSPLRCHIRPSNFFIFDTQLKGKNKMSLQIEKHVLISKSYLIQPAKNKSPTFSKCFTAGLVIKYCHIRLSLPYPWLSHSKLFMQAQIT